MHQMQSVSMCRISVKYQYTIRALCAYAHVFSETTGCGRILACALIRTNMVYIMMFMQTISMIKVPYVNEIFKSMVTLSSG